MRTTDIVALIVLIVGGLNWLLVGLFQFDLVAAIFGGPAALLSRIVYIVVGICAIWLAVRLPAMMENRPRAVTATGRPVDRTVDRP